MSNRNIILAAGGAGGAPVEVDPYFNQTTLLLHGDGTNGAQNKTFVDESGNVSTITKAGTPTLGSFSPYSLPEGEWSIYTAANSYINTSTSSDFSCGTGAFTIEFWLNPSSTSIGYTFDLQSYSPRMTIFVEGGYLKIYDGAYQILGPLTVGEWAHWAICRTSTTDNKIYTYKNGVYQGNYSGNSSNTSSSWTYVRIGGYPSTNYSLDGFLSNIRMIKNQNLMSSNPTGDFDPPTGPISATEVGWGGANVDSSITGTVALVCAQSNRFINNAGNAVTLSTFSGTNEIQPYSPLAPSSSYDPLVNGGSIYLHGLASDKIYGSPSSLTGEFTIQCWAYATSISGLSNAVPFGNWSPGILVRFGETNAKVEMYVSGSLGNNSGSQTYQLRAGYWVHIEVTRDSSNVFRLFLDGVQMITFTQAGTFSLSNLCIGAENTSRVTGDMWRGYISGFQILNGTCLHASGFDVPTSPPTNVTNTSYLLNFTNAGIFDSCAKGDLETINQAQVDTSTVKFGTGSMKFDGSADYLSLTNLRLVQFLQKDFTIEFWLNINSTAQQYFVDWGTGIIYCASGGQLRYYAAGTLRISGPTMSTGTWYYIALSRKSGSTRMFVDGTQVGVTYADSNSYAPTVFHIGGSTPDTNGFIDELRISDVGRYDTNFTPPDKAFPDQ